MRGIRTGRHDDEDDISVWTPFFCPNLIFPSPNVVVVDVVVFVDVYTEKYFLASG